MTAHWQQEKERIDAIRELKSRIEETRMEADRAERDGDLQRAAELRYGVLVELDKQLEAENAALTELQRDRTLPERGGHRGRRRRGRLEVDRHPGLAPDGGRDAEARPPRGGAPRAGRRPGRGGARRSPTRSVAPAPGCPTRTSPIGSFLFLGPTGVGKTELAKALADYLFDDERAVVRVDMSEYQERHSVSRLVGAPPGYVGYEEGGQLTEAVRRRPYSVVLLDEMEKAHADVFNVLLQLLDDGRLTDGQGRTVDFRNAIVIMTSNLGSAVFDDPSMDREKQKQAVLDDVRGFFRPEFVNRIDEIVVFEPLGREEIAQIVDIQLRSLLRRLEERNLTVELTDAARAYLADKGYDPAFGARPLKRLIQREIQDPLALQLLSGEIRDGETVTVDAGEDGLVFRTSATGT